MSTPKSLASESKTNIMLDVNDGESSSLERGDQHGSASVEEGKSDGSGSIKSFF